MRSVALVRGVMRGALLGLALLGCGTPAGPAPAPPVQPAPSSPLGLIEATLDLDGTLVGASHAPATIVVLFASWCGHCRVELDVIATLRPGHPAIRILGVNYTAHEEYDGRGNAAAVRAYVARSAPWLRVVPAGESLFAALGRPPMVPTLFVFDRVGALVATFDRRERALPDAAELAALLRRLGA